ncbi:MAG: M28 family peptidase, partial [Planctomycetota bacterium]
MQKRLLVIFLFLCLIVITGCVSIPHEQLSRAIETQELSDHVHFLAQPALKGRKPRTWESATARRYLKDRFETYGLLPWGQAKGYEQPFGFGTNVIGVLPGSDPNFADEIVMLVAHYDHVGKTKKGVLLGACDNASGVAVLLEIAERLALSERRQRRTICFASFDCEEKCTLGSFIFTCQEDFDKSKIAAVVNVDLLGRDFLDIIDGSLLVVGTELYPKLRTQILKAGTENGVKILPIGTDLVGPRGDHVAFEMMDIPILFFTCGLYKDYHKPTDTADKLNYPKMRKSAALIAQTVD